MRGQKRGRTGGLPSCKRCWHPGRRLRALDFDAPFSSSDGHARTPGRASSDAARGWLLVPALSRVYHYTLPPARSLVPIGRRLLSLLTRTPASQPLARASARNDYQWPIATSPCHRMTISSSASAHVIISYECDKCGRRARHHTLRTCRSRSKASVRDYYVFVLQSPSSTGTKAITDDLGPPSEAATSSTR